MGPSKPTDLRCACGSDKVAVSEDGELFNCFSCDRRTIRYVLQPRVVVEPSPHGRDVLRLRFSLPVEKDGEEGFDVQEYDLDLKHAKMLAAAIVSVT